MKNNVVPRRLLSREEKEEISKGTIERFEEYINKYVEEYKMTNENEKISEEQVNMNNEKNPFDEIGGDYIKLEKDKAKILLLVNWKIENIKKFKDEEGNLKEQKEFQADCLNEDGVICKKVFATTSFNALKGLKEVFGKYWPETSRAVKIRIKKIGEGKATIYDIEEQKF